MMHPVKKLRATLALLGWSCGRVGQELRDIQLELEGERYWFDVLTYVEPIEVAEREVVKEAWLAALRKRADELLDPFPVAVPRRNGAFYMRVEAPTADAAAHRMLDFIREAFAQAGLLSTSIRIEVAQV